MGTPFKQIIDNFTSMIFEHRLTVLTEEERDGWMTILMNTACSKFSKTCRKDLSARTEDSFEAELDDVEIDIICNYMLVEWLKPYLYSSEILRERLSTKDYSEYSPANLIDKINVLYDDTVKKSRLLAVNYTYSYRDYKECLKEAMKR